MKKFTNSPLSVNYINITFLLDYLCACSDFLALNVYIALCYYKLDYYDVSQEVLAVYLQRYPDSVIATNLKACNYFRLYNGKAAEAEIKMLLVSKRLTFLFTNSMFIKLN